VSGVWGSENNRQRENPADKIFRMATAQIPLPEKLDSKKQKIGSSGVTHSSQG
jgi:hypothetical protein